MRKGLEFVRIASQRLKWASQLIGAGTASAAPYDHYKANADYEKGYREAVTKNLECLEQSKEAWRKDDEMTADEITVEEHTIRFFTKIYE